MKRRTPWLMLPVSLVRPQGSTRSLVTPHVTILATSITPPAPRREVSGHKCAGAPLPPMSRSCLPPLPLSPAIPRCPPPTPPTRPAAVMKCSDTGEFDGRPGNNARIFETIFSAFVNLAHAFVLFMDTHACSSRASECSVAASCFSAR